MNNKNELRKQIRIRKQSFSKEELLQKSVVIKDVLMSDAEVNKAKIILVYWSLPDEVHTHELVTELSKHKTVLLPVVDGKDLVLKQFTGIEQMRKVPPFGILEPMGEEFTDFKSIDLVIVPGMAFDMEGNRLGRGKAFYDGLLPKLSCQKIGICFDFQFLEMIPAEDHDVTMDRVIYDVHE